MPELPEVETIVRGLAKGIVGKKIVSLKTSRQTGEKIVVKEIKQTIQLPPIIGGLKNKFISGVIGSSIEEIKRRGKAIIIDLSNNYSLVMHLKMTGQLIYTNSREQVVKHTHMIFELSDGNELRYVDVRRFGYIKLLLTKNIFSEKPLNALGYEPIDIKLTELRGLLSGRKVRMKSFLLNQSFLAGIGNIYADEILHRGGIHPLRLSSKLNNKEVSRLHKTIKKVLKEAIKHRGSTIRDYVTSTGEEGSFQKLHRVYGREGKACVSCGRKIEKIKAAGRSTFLCPVCQPIDER